MPFSSPNVRYISRITSSLYYSVLNFQHILKALATLAVSLKLTTTMYVLGWGVFIFPDISKRPGLFAPILL